MAAKKRKPGRASRAKGRDAGQSKPAGGLSPKQKLFVAEYLIDLNAAAAYKRAGYAAPNNGTASAGGARLLANVSIQEAIAAGMAERSNRTQIKADDVLREWALIALSDIGEILDFSQIDPHLRPASEIPERARRAIASIKVKRHTEGAGDDAREVEITEFKLWDKLNALRQVAQHLNMLKNEQTVKGTGPNGEIEHSVKGTVKHEPGDPSKFASAFKLLADAVFGAGVASVREDGSLQPLDTPRAAPEAGAVPDPR